VNAAASRAVTAGAAAGAVTLLAGLGYHSERSYLDHAPQVRVATPYDLGKLAIEAATGAGGLVLAVAQKGPLGDPRLRGIALAVGCMGAAGFAYRGAAMLARYEHVSRNAGDST
jgi:hypothetical protein